MHRDVQVAEMEKVLVNCVNRYLKGLLLRLLVEVGLDVAEATDEEDVKLKLNLYGESIILFVLEITERSRERLYAEVQRLKTGKNPYTGKILAIVPNDSVEMVGGAQKAGIGDIVLLPPQRERYHAALLERIQVLTESVRNPQTAAQTDADEREIPELQADDGNMMRAGLMRELKLASRGGHTVSFLMVHTVGLSDAELQRFSEELSGNLRDTDRLMDYDRATFIVVCPFTQKSFLVEVERKVHQAYSKLYGDYGKERRAYLYGANYPSESKDIDKLLNHMENGIHDSMAYTALRGPLHKLSPTEIEQFRRKLKLYRV